MSNPYMLPLADCRHDIATGDPSGTAARMAGLILLAWRWDEDERARRAEAWLRVTRSVDDAAAVISRMFVGLADAVCHAFDGLTAAVSRPSSDWTLADD